MPYTRPWSTAVPTGGENANTIDDEIRNLREDLTERIDGTLVVDITADPWVPVAGGGGGGAVTGKQLLFSYAAFDKIDHDSNGQNYGDAVATIKYTAPVVLPLNANLKKVELLYDKGSASNMTLELHSRAFAVGGSSGSTIVGTITDATVGINVLELDVDETFDGSLLYWVMVLGGGAFPSLHWKLFGLRLTYDSPDTASTY